jgi:hypothetical protein
MAGLFALRMPAVTHMSYTRKNNHLAPSLRVCCVTRDALYAFVCFACVASTLGGCASLPAPSSHTVDFTRASSEPGALDAYKGKVVLLDVCTSWVAACNLNAKVLDEVTIAFEGRPLVAVTLLLDDDTVGAIESYRKTLGVKHEVVLAGPRVRAFNSVLGDTGYVPRLVVLDAQGRVRLDEAGGVVGVEGLVERVRPLVQDAEAK